MVNGADGYAKYIGRVGALAVALGVGAAVATGPLMGIAQADDDPAATDASVDVSSDPSEPSTPEPGDQLDAQPPAAGSNSPEPNKTATNPAENKMQIDSSGGIDTSLNDEGQSTDDDADGDDEVTTPAPQAEPEKLSAPENNRGRQSNSGATTPPGGTPPTGNAALTVKLHTDDDAGSTAAATNARASTQSRLSLAPTSGAQVQRLAASSEQESGFSTLASTAGVETQATAQGLPGMLVNIATTVVGAFLSPFLAPGPTAPAQPPLLFALLGWVQREIQRAFFNRTPEAVVDTATTYEDTPMVINALANDTDVEDNTITSPCSPSRSTASGAKPRRHLHLHPQRQLQRL